MKVGGLAVVDAANYVEEEPNTVESLNEPNESVAHNEYYAEDVDEYDHNNTHAENNIDTVSIDTLNEEFSNELELKIENFTDCKF